MQSGGCSKEDDAEWRRMQNAKEEEDVEWKVGEDAECKGKSAKEEEDAEC